MMIKIVLPVLPCLTLIGALFFVTSAIAGDIKSLTPQAILNDYPTESRADYIFGCMAANGQNRKILRRCACSIDWVASVLPYAEYVAAETVLSLRQTSGERMSIFRNTQVSKNYEAALRRAQAEAEILCF